MLIKKARIAQRKTIYTLQKACFSAFFFFDLCIRHKSLFIYCTNGFLSL